MKYKKRLKSFQANNEILFSLPLFINQLLLLLNSGMVLTEAMITIALNYQKIDDCERNAFERDYYRIYEESQKNGTSMLNCFSEYAKRKHIKELSRIAGVLSDSGKKGSELWSKLAEEGEILWAQRKRIALEKIRLTESKMSFPLGLLLMALIIMTAAPAMMQMSID